MGIAARLGRAFRATSSSAAAAIALITSAVALAFSAWPALRPDPRNVLAAKLHVRTIEPAVTLSDYLSRTDQRLEGASRSILRTRGYVVYLLIQAEGRKHGDLSLEQVVYRASTARRIAHQTSTQDSLFNPDTPNDQWIARVFVPEPPYGFPVFIRLELFDGKTLMAFADTRTLRPRPGRF